MGQNLNHFVFDASILSGKIKGRQNVPDIIVSGKVEHRSNVFHFNSRDVTLRTQTTGSAVGEEVEAHTFPQCEARHRTAHHASDVTDLLQTTRRQTALTSSIADLCRRHWCRRECGRCFERAKHVGWLNIRLVNQRWANHRWRDSWI